MQMYYIRVRDELCKNGEILLTPALNFTDRHLQAVIEVRIFMATKKVSTRINLHRLIKVHNCYRCNKVCLD